jgi:hypothetical protein
VHGQRWAMAGSGQSGQHGQLLGAHRTGVAEAGDEARQGRGQNQRAVHRRHCKAAHRSLREHGRSLPLLLLYGCPTRRAGSSLSPPRGDTMAARGSRPLYIYNILGA